MKGNDGHGARRQFSRKLLVIVGGLSVILLFVLLVMPSSTTHIKKPNEFASRLRQHSLETMKHAAAAASQHKFAYQFRKDLQDQYKDDQEELDVMQLALEGKVHLVDIHVVEAELFLAPEDSYAGVYGSFCRLDWHKHKEDPSGVPMFRDLVGKSPDCEDPHRLDIHKLVTLARKQEADDDKQADDVSTVKVLDLSAVVFHESRCGSTLVANMLAAMDPPKHRVYSESQPGATAIKGVCGDNFSRCSIDQAATVLRDVVYLMSRSDDPQEERVFFKFQSITTKSVKVFQKAFPNVPWMFVYRDPVQVMMSHVKDGLKNANCVRSQRNPPREVHSIAVRHGKLAKEMPREDYCAAHLASITESAVAGLSNQDNPHGIPIDYADLPAVLYESVLPKIIDRPLTETEITNIQEVSQQYSKGRGPKKGTFEGDSERKEEAASEAVRQAAQTYLQESFDILSKHRPK